MFILLLVQKERTPPEAGRQEKMLVFLDAPASGFKAIRFTSDRPYPNPLTEAKFQQIVLCFANFAEVLTKNNLFINLLILDNLNSFLYIKFTAL